MNTQAEILDEMVNDPDSDMAVYDYGYVTAVSDGTDFWACRREDYDHARAVLADTLVGNEDEDAGTVSYQALCDLIGTTFGTSSSPKGSEDDLRALAARIVFSASLEGNDNLEMIADVATEWLADHYEFE